MLKAQELRVQPVGWEHPLEKEMVTRFSILACRILRTEEPDRLWSIWLQKVGYD